MMVLNDSTFWFGLAAVGVNAAGYVPYIRGILRGSVRPQRITWGIWTLLTTIAAVNQVANDGGYSTYFFASTTLLVLIVFVLSLRRGVGGRSAFDATILIAALGLFVVWGFTRDTRTTTLIAIAIDGIGALPTLVKTYRRPETEAYAQWILAGVSGGLALLALGTRTDPILFCYPLYVIGMNAVIVLAKLCGTRLGSRPTTA
jgi:hypothetical protein